MDEGDGSTKSSILKEWNLFWQSFLGEDEEVLEELTQSDERIMNLNKTQLRALTRALSQDRKVINQKLEYLNTEIELNQLKLESAKLVSGDVDEIQERLEELHDLGVQYSHSLEKVDRKIKLTRMREAELLNEELKEA